MSHPRFVYINNRCGYQSVTQQYLKKMFNKGWSKLHVSAYYGHHQVFIRKYGGSALQDWYEYVTMVRSQHLRCLLYAIFKGHRGGICDVRYPGVCSSSMSARCYPMWVSSYCLSIFDVYCWWAFVMGCVCSLSFVSVVISVCVCGHRDHHRYKG